MEKTFAFGVDIGGTNTKIGLFDQTGSLLSFKALSTDKTNKPEIFVEQIAQEANLMMSSTVNLTLDSEKLVGVGIGAPMANYFTGRIEHAPNLNWRDVPLKDHFEKYFKKKALIENDANLAAVGESRWGAGKDFSDFILITLGTGVGTGLILSKRLYRGYNALGGEGGHVIIPHNKQRLCSCGGMNHLESFLSARGIKQTILELTGEDWTLEQMSELYKQKNLQAISVVDTITDELALGLVSMAVLMGPEAFIIGGGVAKIGDQFMKLLEKKINEKIHFSLRNKIKTATATVSAEKGAVYGGAALVFHEKDL